MMGPELKRSEDVCRTRWVSDALTTRILNFQNDGSYHLRYLNVIEGAMYSTLDSLSYTISSNEVVRSVPGNYWGFLLFHIALARWLRH